MRQNVELCNQRRIGVRLGTSSYSIVNGLIWLYGAVVGVILYGWTGMCSMSTEVILLSCIVVIGGAGVLYPRGRASKGRTYACKASLWLFCYFGFRLPPVGGR